MKLIKYSAGLLFFALFLAAAAAPAAAWTAEDWIEGGDGYMVNNVIIEIGSIGVSTDDTSKNVTGNVSITIYEWKNAKWERINGTKLSLDQSMNFKAADGNYTVKVLDLREIGRFNEAKLEIWTNAEVATSKGTVIDGGHQNAEGAGMPNLVVTTIVTPSGNLSVDDIVTVSIHVENKGNYEAKNVNIDAPQPVGVLITGITINNVKNQSFRANDSQTVYSYQAKLMQPGSVTFNSAKVTAENSLGQTYNYTGSNVTVQVNDLAALVFTSTPASGSTVDPYTRSKIERSVTIRNTGTLPAQGVRIDFAIPQNVFIDGKEMNGNGSTGTANIIIDQILPNNERTITYTLTASEEGNYEVTSSYSYAYNSSSKTGALETTSFRAVGSATIKTALDNWYLVFIPIILIGAVALFFWKRHREYKF